MSVFFGGWFLYRWAFVLVLPHKNTHTRIHTHLAYYSMRYVCFILLGFFFVFSHEALSINYGIPLSVNTYFTVKRGVGISKREVVPLPHV